MNAFAYWAIIFIVGFSSGLWVQSQSGAIENDLITQVIPSALGNAFGIILIPILFIVLPKKLYALFKRKTYKPNRILTTLVSGFVLFALVSQANRENIEFTFIPQDCDFTVSFPSEPTTYDFVHHEGTDYEAKGKGAQYISKDGVSVMKAECSPISSDFNSLIIENADHELIMNQIAQALQLNNTTFSKKIEPDFLTYVIDGYRTIENQKYKYRITNYISESSNLTVYRVSSPENFSLTELENFEDSVSYTPNDRTED